MSKTYNDYIEEAQSGILDLRKIKAGLHDQLSDVKVKVDLSTNDSISSAINEIFGERSDDDPDKGYITFDMYMQCLNIIRLAGQAKAETILERV
jgi:hypothetical protein